MYDFGFGTWLLGIPDPSPGSPVKGSPYKSPLDESVWVRKFEGI